MPPHARPASDGQVDFLPMPAAPHPRIGWAFTCRSGGFSHGPWGGPEDAPGLNLGTHCGDDPGAVARNRALLAQAIGQPIRWLNQVHGTHVFQADQAPPAASPPTHLPGTATPTATDPAVPDTNALHAQASHPAPEADAQITTQPGQALAVMVADCLPVLLADREGRVVGATHAGWRGLAAGVIEATVAQMRQALAPHERTSGLSLSGAAIPPLPPAAPNTGPEDELVAWLGPCIGPAAFEVGNEVREAFLQHAPQAADAFTPGRAAGKWLANLPLLAQQRLAALGITEIHTADACTFSQPERFWSYRRTPSCGRMAALVWLRGCASGKQQSNRNPAPGMQPAISCRPD